MRGAQSWRGAESDSFALRVMWDAETLYLAAEVRDPQHEQTGIGPGVGGQDALWVYLDDKGQGRRISAKFTLAQTPQGPQVWDWKAGFALPNARMAWKAADGGYTYEAAIPWESLGVRAPAAGQHMGIEVGRGFGGSSFLDLSGRDPDSASNLLPLLLVKAAGQAPAAERAPTAGAADPASVALAIAIDDGDPVLLPQARSPDRDYLWLDMVGSAPVHLAAGQHTLQISYAGTDPARSAIIDAFLLAPAMVRQQFQGPGGAALTLSYTMRTAALSWEEQGE